MSKALRRETTVVTSAKEARRLGPYVLVGEIAEGGMGRVYLARQEGAAGFEKLVAIKVMLPEKAKRGDDHLEMFFDEARIASRIVHPNVATVYDFGQADGVRYLVMEYLAGQAIMEIIHTLDANVAVRTEPHFHAIAARVVAEACEGLHGAHCAVDDGGRPLHVVHRDVSPENVLVTYEGAVKVMDFGIAKATGRLHHTAAGVFKGKLPYASPEAVRIERLDPRSDVWSIGVVLWELLTGRSCFMRKTDMETVRAVVKEPIPPPSALRLDTPPELDAIALRALSRDPTERFASCRDMAKALNRYAVSAGLHVGTGEIAEWMGRLYPDGPRRAAETEGAVRRLDRDLGAAPALGAGGLSEPLVVQGPTRRAATPIGFEDEATIAQSPRARASGRDAEKGHGFDIHAAQTRVPGDRATHALEPGDRTIVDPPRPGRRRLEVFLLLLLVVLAAGAGVVGAALLAGR